MQLLKAHAQQSLIDGGDTKQNDRQREVLLDLHIIHLVVSLQHLKTIIIISEEESNLSLPYLIFVVAQIPRVQLAIELLASVFFLLQLQHFRVFVPFKSKHLPEDETAVCLTLQAFPASR